MVSVGSITIRVKRGQTDMNGRPIAVIGKTGQLAEALQRLAAERGTALIAGGRPQVDLVSNASLQALLDKTEPGVVINAAAYTAVDKAEDDRDAAFALNATGPGQLAALCAKAAIPLIHVSTDYVFDGTKTTPYLVGDRANPKSVYGASKAAGEEAIRAAQPHHAIVRTAWVYGQAGGNFVKTMLRLGAERDELRVVADQIGQPTFADDLASGLLAIADRMQAEPQASPDSEIFGTFHLTGAGETSWHGFASEIFRLAREHGHKTPNVLPIPATDYPLPAARPAYSVLDCSRTQSVFGINRPEWTAALARAIPGILARP